MGLVLPEVCDALAQKLVSAPIPVVAVADAAQDISSVVVDDAAGSRMIVDYLVQKGHQRVLYRRGRPHQSSERRRYEAFMITSAKAGLAVVEDFDRPANFAYTLSEPEIAILHQPDAVRPTVVVCNNDLIAYNTFDYCEAAHIRVPEDLAIIGFDGMVPQVRTAAALTTIRAPWFQVAKTALDLVMRRLDGEAIPLETMLPVELVVGKTA